MIAISVVILTCNQRAYTERCLDSIRPLLGSDDCEVIVVDNGSVDGTAEMVETRYGNVVLIKSEYNRGVAAGRNFGLRRARGKYLMILDNDTIASAETVRSLAAYLAANPDVGLLAPRLISPNGTVQTSFKPYPGIISKISNIIRGRDRSSVAATYPTEPYEPFYVIGAAQMFPTEIYALSGGLDENIFFGPEDADFCMAVRSLGKKVVYLPSLTIVHDWQRATSRRLLSKGAFTHLRGLVYFYKKHRRWFR